MEGLFWNDVTTWGRFATLQLQTLSMPPDCFYCRAMFWQFGPSSLKPHCKSPKRPACWNLLEIYTKKSFYDLTFLHLNKFCIRRPLNLKCCTLQSTKSVFNTIRLKIYQDALRWSHENSDFWVAVAPASHNATEFGIPNCLVAPEFICRRFFRPNVAFCRTVICSYYYY